MAKTIVICVEFLLDVARQTLLKSANVHGAIQKAKVARFFHGPRCILLLYPDLGLALLLKLKLAASPETGLTMDEATKHSWLL